MAQPHKGLDELVALAHHDGHRVVDVDVTRGEDRLSTFIVVRHGNLAFVINAMTFEDHLCADVLSFADGEHVTGSAFGMTEGRQVEFPPTGTTSLGRPSTDMVAVIVGPQAETDPEDIRAHVRELHPKITLRGRTDAELSRAHAASHHRNGSLTHHHGPNAGPHGRPAGWRTGGGVVRTDGRATRGQVEVTRAWSPSTRPGPSAP
jgi:hypothetical protein